MAFKLPPQPDVDCEDAIMEFIKMGCDPIYLVDPIGWRCSRSDSCMWEEQGYRRALTTRKDCSGMRVKPTTQDDGFTGEVFINYFDSGGDCKTCDFQCDFDRKDYCIAGLRVLGERATPGPYCPGPGTYRIKLKRVED